MATIKNTERLCKRALLTNIYLHEGISITPLLSGAHGLGKSAICHKIAKDLHGIALVVEGGSLKEGEITGLPKSNKKADGTEEVSFVPYFQTAKIQRLEKAIYTKALSTGFLNGTVKINADGDTEYIDSNNKLVVLKKNNDFINIINGTENSYKFGENLPADIKMKLLESEEIMPIIIFIDEMNRTDGQTMKELMNLVLTRSINGYSFPWWCFFISAINPCGQDSVYSTNEFDAAQLDRFLKIRVDADINEWIDYELDNNANVDYITALSMIPDIFKTTGKGYDDNTNDDLSPSPRSHEICSYIYNYKHDISNSKFFTKEEAEFETEDIQTLIKGKIGTKAGRTIMDAIKNKDNYIDPKDILTGTATKINEQLANKISNMRPIAKCILLKTINKYIATDLIRVFIDQSDSAHPDNAKAAKAKWGNIINQLKEVYSYVDDATLVVTAKDMLKTYINLSEAKYKKYDNQTLFAPLCACFKNEVISILQEVNGITANNDINKK